MARPALTSDNTVGAIVLAAGHSTRMGRPNKLLADLCGAPVIVRTVDALFAAGLSPPIVVVGYMAASVRVALDGRPVRFAVAPDYADGLSRSLIAGLAAAPDYWRAALIILADMPMVAVATLTAIAHAADDGRVVVPTHAGRRGNPVAWGRAHWPRLAALTGDRGARALLDQMDLIEVATNDPGIHIDVDTPEALAEVRRIYSSS